MKNKILIALLIIFMLPCALILGGCGDDGGNKMTIAEFREIIADSGLFGTDMHVLTSERSGTNELWFNGSGDDIRLKMPTKSKLVNDSQTKAFKYYGKIGNDYYEVTTYEGMNITTQKLEILLTEYVKLTKNECLTAIRRVYDSYFADWNLNLQENMRNKEEFINLFGADKYYYREKFEESSESVLTIQTASYENNYVFEYIQIGVEENNIATYSLPTDVVYELRYNVETNKFANFCANVNISDEYDFNTEGTCARNMGINVSTDPQTTLFTMPTFEIDNDNIDADRDMSAVTGDGKITVQYKNCNGLVEGKATPFENFELPTPECQANYEFLGWFDYYGDKVDGALNASGKLNNITLYAKWKNPADPIINLNGGTLISKPTGKIILAEYVSDIEVYKPGYVLKDWTNAGGGTCKYDYFTQINSSYVVNAKWEKKTTVNFDINGATPKMGPIYMEAGSGVTLPSNLKKPGKIFVGWYKDAGFLEKADSNYAVPSSDATLYAKFDDAYTLTVVDILDYSTQYVIPTTGDYDDFEELYDGVLNTYRTEGYGESMCFAGWYTDPECTTGFSGYPTEDMTIYAKKSNDWYLMFDFIGDYATTLESTYGQNGYFDVEKNGDLYYNNVNPAPIIIIDNLFSIGTMSDTNNFYVSLCTMFQPAFVMDDCRIDGIYLDEEKTTPLFSTERDSAEEVLSFWHQHFAGPLTLYVEIVKINPEP